LFRFDPRLIAEGKNPMQLDSQPPSIPLEEYVYNESRYTMLKQNHPETAKRLLEEAQQDVRDRWKIYEMWAHMAVNHRDQAEAPAAQDTARTSTG
jgi:pyruvate-ferredoxin/flavodoxin oxidoreductase